MQSSSFLHRVVRPSVLHGEFSDLDPPLNVHCTHNTHSLTLVIIFLFNLSPHRNTFTAFLAHVKRPTLSKAAMIRVWYHLVLLKRLVGGTSTLPSLVKNQVTSPPTRWQITNVFWITVWQWEVVRGQIARRGRFGLNFTKMMPIVAASYSHLTLSGQVG